MVKGIIDGEERAKNLENKYFEACPKQLARCKVLAKRQKTITFLVHQKSLTAINENGGYLVFHIHGKRFKYGKFLYIITTEKQYKEWTGVQVTEMRNMFAAEAESHLIAITADQMDFLLNTKIIDEKAPYIEASEKMKYGLKVLLFKSEEDPMESRQWSDFDDSIKA